MSDGRHRPTARPRRKSRSVPGPQGRIRWTGSLDELREREPAVTCPSRALAYASPDPL
jgi:hypothetical protein